MSDNTEIPDGGTPGQVVDIDPIRGLEGLDYVRQRAAVYFNDLSVSGLLHQVQEVTDNMYDELMVRVLQMVESASTQPPRGTIVLYIDAERQTYQVVVRDTGRGIIPEKLVMTYTKLLHSGKFDQDAYKISGGNLGQGGKAAAGSSEYFRSISTTMSGRRGEVLIHRGHVKSESEDPQKFQGHHGTTVILEPDKTIFTDVEQFPDYGRLELANKVKKYCYFQPYDIKFYVSQTPLPPDIWFMPMSDAVAYIERTIETSAQLVCDGVSYDRAGWLRSYIGTSKHFVWEYSLYAPMNSTADDYGFIVNFYYAKNDRVFRRFGLVNGIAIDDLGSSHIKVPYQLLASMIAKRIKEPLIRKFFTEAYEFPITLAIDAKYSGAVFVSTTKHAFRDKTFEEILKGVLEKHMYSPEGEARVDELFTEIWEDIESKYMASLGDTKKEKNLLRIDEVLHYPENFYPCSTKDRTKALIFLTEGQSAASDEGRDAAHHAIYAMRGKPINGFKKITDSTGLLQARTDVTTSKVFFDILKIIGLDPHRPNLEGLNYQEIVITTDADTDGDHITELTLGGFYAVSPELVASGRILIALPPLFGLEYVKKTKQTPAVYLRDQEAVIRWKALNLYKEMVRIIFEHPVNGRLIPDDENFIHLVHFILDVGKDIENLSKELGIPAITVEQLTHVTQYLEPRFLTDGNLELIKERLCADKMYYDANRNMLMLSIGMNDWPLRLDGLANRLYERIIPKLRSIGWRDINLLVYTNHSHDLQGTPMSIMQIKQIFENLDGAFETTRFKGLGKMPPEDLVRTCMDAETRSVFRITSIGDAERIFEILGGDSEHRKHLLRQYATEGVPLPNAPF